MKELKEIVTSYWGCEQNRENFEFYDDNGDLVEIIENPNWKQTVEK